MVLDVYWCSFTNLFCIFPVWLSYKRKLQEGFLYGLTGIISILYHLHHRDKFNKPYKDFLNYKAIRATDLIMSDLCVYWVVTEPSVRNLVMFSIIPFEIYVVVSKYPYVRLISELIWVFLNLSYLFLKKIEINKKKVFCAVASSCLEMIFYEILTTIYPQYYNWVHGVHHIFGFLSIYFYMQRHDVVEVPSGHRRVFSFENLTFF